MTLAVGVVGAGWCGREHIRAFNANPHSEVVAVCVRDPERARSAMTEAGIDVTKVAVLTSLSELLELRELDVVSIATPHDLHVAQAVAALDSGKHVLIEKPTALDFDGLKTLRAAAVLSGTRTTVSFELRYNPLIKFMHWFRCAGRLGQIRFARAQYLSRVTDWYSGWEWCRTTAQGGSHLLVGGCHAVDALRWCSGLEAESVTAMDAHFTDGYEFATTVAVNMRMTGGALAQVTSSTDMMLPYTFSIELMGDKATIRDNLILWKDDPVDIDELREANPFPDVELELAPYGSDGQAISIKCLMPDSVGVDHHPFQAEIDDFVDAICSGRETMLNVFEAERTIELCLAADLSASRGGARVDLPILGSGGQS